MARGLSRLHHAAQTQQARRDWQRLATYAQAHGYAADADRLTPPANAGWRTIDKRISELRQIMQVPPLYQWRTEEQP